MSTHPSLSCPLSLSPTPTPSFPVLPSTLSLSACGDCGVVARTPSDKVLRKGQRTGCENEYGRCIVGCHRGRALGSRAQRGEEWGRFDHGGEAPQRVAHAGGGCCGS